MGQQYFNSSPERIIYVLCTMVIKWELYFQDTILLDANNKTIAVYQRNKYFFS